MSGGVDVAEVEGQERRSNGFGLAQPVEQLVDARLVGQVVVEDRKNVGRSPAISTSDPGQNIVPGDLALALGRHPERFAAPPARVLLGVAVARGVKRPGSAGSTMLFETMPCRAG